MICDTKRGVFAPNKEEWMNILGPVPRATTPTRNTGLENKTTFGSSERKFVNVEQGPGALHYEPRFGQFTSHDPRFDGPTPEPIRTLVEPSKRIAFDQMHGSAREEEAQR